MPLNNESAQNLVNSSIVATNQLYQGSSDNFSNIYSQPELNKQFLPSKIY